AMDMGVSGILLGIGGSATNDGGAGMAQVLGYRLLDSYGADLPPGGAALLRLARIDASRRDPRLGRTVFRTACDVRNPLLGPDGASFTFGPQKGASPDDCALLDRALARFAEIVERDIGVNVREIPGGGAAGGLGAGAVAFLGASLLPGIEVVLDATGFREALREADAVVTGEGRLDAQTSRGKAPLGVARACREAGVPCLAVAGSVERTGAAADRMFAGCISLTEMFPGLSTEELMSGARDCLIRLGPRLAAMIESVS
ncbi:MAG: glycerate kinase, partial [Planctomycetota bacterium]|nr:glycerate kinase [Planctomycetota bacterium]